MTDADHVSTARLDLRPMAPGDLDALLKGLEDPEHPWAPGYPLEATLVAAAMVAERVRGADDAGPWTQYQARDRNEGVVVGDLTFLDPPDADGVALVTFGISPDRRGRGYATETLRGVLSWASERHDVSGLRADTDLVDPAAPRVLRAAGLSVVHDDGDHQVYERRWSRRGSQRGGPVAG